MWLCAMLFTQLSFGQITFEKAYKGSLSYTYKHFGNYIVNGYISTDENGTITIYNLDLSIRKTIKVNLPKDVKIHQFTTSFLYYDVINSDPLMELSWTISDSDNNNMCYCEIINENGDIIKKFEDCFTVMIVPTENGFKLTRHGYRNDEVEIYSLPSTPNSIPSIEPEATNRPYPNPAGQLIHIPYQLSGKWGIVSIYNATGQLIEQKKVDQNFDHLLLNVSDYAKGMYYFKVDKQRGEFMVK